MTTCTVSWCDREAVANGLCDRCRVRARAGIDPDQPPMRMATDADRDRLRPEMTRRREAGQTYQQIADAVGISHVTTARWLKLWQVEAPAREWPHGRPGAFITHSCRCEVCLPAFREYKRAERERRLTRPVAAEHGTVLAYQQGCRCDDCTETMRASLRERNESTRAGATHHGQRWTGADAEIAYTRADLTIAERAEMLGRTFSSVDNFIRTYNRRPDDPFGIKRT